jgi:hypothetical protein
MPFKIGNKLRLKHGCCKNPLYSVWDDMKRRCYNPERKQYKDWGGRGIIVCKEWLKDPIVFIEWAEKNGYKKGLSFDRIDNNGNYEPNNCRFITKKENGQKKRRPTQAHCDKKSGLPLGVSKNGNNFRVEFWNNSKRYNIGTYPTTELASQAYQKAVSKYPNTCMKLDEEIKN